MEGIEWRYGWKETIKKEFDCDPVLAGAVSGGMVRVRERSSNGGEYCGGGQVFEDIVRGSLFAELEWRV